MLIYSLAKIPNGDQRVDKSQSLSQFHPNSEMHLTDKTMLHIFNSNAMSLKPEIKLEYYLDDQTI